jgi:hypothetical protein
MAITQRNKAGYPSPWKSATGSFTAAASVHLILTSNARIPMRYWRPYFRFIGLRDATLHSLSDGAFPRKLEAGKMHPLFSLERLADGIGFKLCPCSSKKPFEMSRYRYIREGCQLLHTEEIVDRNSYLVENITLNIPPSMYRDMKFRGEVPEACIESVSG